MWCSARPAASAPRSISRDRRRRGTGGFVHPRRGCGRLLGHFGLLGRGHQRRRLRRPHHRGALGDGPGATARTVPATAMWCSARPAASAPRSISRNIAGAAPAASSSTARMRTIIRPFGLLGRRHQRRRLRRPHRRGSCADGPRGAGHAHRCRRQLCGVRQGGRVRRGDRSRRRRRRHRRLRHPRRGCGRPLRRFGLLGRRHRRRRLRRPHRRGALCRRPGAAPGTRNDAGDSYVLFGSATIGGSANHVTHLGGAGAQTLTGNAAANVMVGGRGNDTSSATAAPTCCAAARATTSSRSAMRPSGASTAAPATTCWRSRRPSRSPTADFRKVFDVESLRLGNGATNLTLGPIAAHAFDGRCDQRIPARDRRRAGDERGGDDQRRHVHPPADRQLCRRQRGCEANWRDRKRHIYRRQRQRHPRWRARHRHADRRRGQRHLCARQRHRHGHR